MILDLIPFKKVGAFILGGNIDPIIEKYAFDFSPVDESGLKSYILKDIGISLYVEEELIESIACHKECNYRGKNIIQMSFNDFKDHTGLLPHGEKDEVYMSDDEVQDVFEFDDIGLQVWVKDNKIVTVIASPYIEDDE